MAFSPTTVLKRFSIGKNLYLLGSFEKGLTIYNQQVRALNVVWALIESAPIKALNNVAVIGGGFAGLTAAAALIRKGVKHVSLYEKRATLCPLQEGSDTRWVHPRIYDWPNADSELPTAALPLLNWNAGRASDVVVEVLQEWDKLIRPIRENTESPQSVHVYVNVKHLRLDAKLSIEWVGEKLYPPFALPSGTQKFDSVILAVGFGSERGAQTSYWRNERLGQPELDIGKRTYLVSGNGDGALVDLFRIRIIRFRQDRILVDLFRNNNRLLTTLRELKIKHEKDPMSPEELFDQFDSVAGDKDSGFDKLLGVLTERLRGDTAAVLQMSPDIDSFKQVFSSPASFQNRFLLFALYRAGGLIPTREKCHDKICSEYGINKNDIICRWGVTAKNAVEDVLDAQLRSTCSKRISSLEGSSSQPSVICWTGGYWDKITRDLGGAPISSHQSKAGWRREHLPPATEVFATGFVAGVAGYLDEVGSLGNDFRVTLHRTLYLSTDVLLQQAARYGGNTGRQGAAGRTFGFNHAAIGYAAVSKKIIQTRPKLSRESEKRYIGDLQDDMDELDLTEDSQRMADTVRSILAVPILTQDRKRTLAVLFADSTNFNAFSMNCILTICKMCQSFASKIAEINFDRVRNIQVPPKVLAPRMPPKAASKLKVLKKIETLTPPSADCTYLNIEFTDFVVAGGS